MPKTVSEAARELEIAIYSCVSAGIPLPYIIIDKHRNLRAALAAEGMVSVPRNVLRNAVAPVRGLTEYFGKWGKTHQSCLDCGAVSPPGETLKSHKDGCKLVALENAQAEISAMLAAHEKEPT